MTHRDALLAAVFAAPDDDLPRLVYADWLDEHGESDHAEFIRLQIQRHGMTGDEPAAEGIDRRINLLRAMNADRWLGPLGSVADPSARVVYATFRRGFASELTVTPNRQTDPFSGPLAQTLALHPVDTLSLRWNPEANANLIEVVSAMEGWPQLRSVSKLSIGRENSNADLELPDEALLRLGRNPHLTGLRALDLGTIRLTPTGLAALSRGPLLDRLTRLSVYPVLQHVDAWFEQLVGLPCLDGLEALDVGGSHLGDDRFARLLDRLAGGRITVLSIGENQLTDAAVAAFLGWQRFDSLRSLGLCQSGIGADALEELFADGGLSNLRELSLGMNARYGRWEAGQGEWVMGAVAGLPSLSQLNVWWNDLTADDIRPLAAAGCLPDLNKLELMGNPIGDDGVEALCQATWAGRIESMGLVMCGLTDRGAEWLAGGPFERLRLNLIRNGNQITAAGLERLRERFGWVH